MMNQLQQILDRGHLVVGTGNANVPWHYEDGTGTLAGFDIEMGRILAKALFDDPGKVEFLEIDPEARIESVLSRRVDIVLQGMSISAYRMRQVTFSVPYYTEGVGLIMKAGGRHKDHSALVSAQRAGEVITIAALQNPDAHEAVEEMVAGSTDLQVRDAGEIRAAVVEGRADAGLADLSSIIWLANAHPDTYADSGFSTHPQNYGGAMHPEQPVWINFVNGVLTDAMTGATHHDYDVAFEKYFGSTPAAPRVGKPGVYRMP